MYIQYKLTNNNYALYYYLFSKKSLNKIFSVLINSMFLFKNNLFKPEQKKNKYLSEEKKSSYIQKN